jgi:type IV pilus assembly protein PilC
MAGLDIREISQRAQHPAARGRAEQPNEAALHYKGVLKDRFKESFYLELATMLEAGLDLRGVLQLVTKEQKKVKQQAVLEHILQTVVQGASFSAALKKSGCFTPYEYFSIQIGEETGQLIKVARELASYYSRKIKQKRQFVNALSYPIVILLTSVGAVGFMLAFIIPMFSDVFKRFGSKLPYLTQVLINLSRGFTDHFWLLLLALAALITAAKLLLRWQPARQRLSVLLIHTPGIGPLVHSLYLARFCGSLALLVAAKVPLLQALGLVRQMVSFYPIAAPLAEVEASILRGHSFSKSLEKHKIFDSHLVALLRVGEEVNSLDVFLERLAQRYSEAVDQRTQLINTFLEPFMIIFLGGMVGIILVAMYMPMFQLSQGFME